VQAALEAEVTEFLGRERCVRGDRNRAGSRDGYCPTPIKTTAGAVKLDRPKLRGTDEQFASRLFGVGACKTAPPCPGSSALGAASGDLQRYVGRERQRCHHVTMVIRQ